MHVANFFTLAASLASLAAATPAPKAEAVAMPVVQSVSDAALEKRDITWFLEVYKGTAVCTGSPAYQFSGTGNKGCTFIGGGGSRFQVLDNHSTGFGVLLSVYSDSQCKNFIKAVRPGNDQRCFDTGNGAFIGSYSVRTDT